MKPTIKHLRDDPTSPEVGAVARTPDNTMTTPMKENTMNTKTTTIPTLSDAQRGIDYLTAASPTRNYAINATAAAEALGYPRSKAVTAALKAWGIARERAASIPQPTTFTAEDLGANDWTERLTAAAIDQQAHTTRQQLAATAALEEQHNVGDICIAEIDMIGDYLEGWMIENLDDLLAIEADRKLDETLARIEDREKRVQLFHNAWSAYRTATSNGPGRVVDYRAQWWQTHTFTPEQWQELLDCTGPHMAAGRPLHLARRVGGTLRLARTWSQPWDDFVAMQQPVDDERIERMYAEGRFTTNVIG